ncbi:hypothetical protein [Litchfieldia alkalitelluris]|uniref:hypothetical protein n=1 Tax=Litchfieldia alkalitelluris TaxID=304268 RepID=UPI001F233EF9|nr:hypothetical protein [Litchfieldia alkalitelluris]
MAKKSDVTLLREHLKQRHTELYGIDYVTRNHAVEGRWLKSMITEFGADVVKRFIDECFAEYKPTKQYPGLNFAFMFSYQRSRILPRILAEVKREQARTARVSHPVIADEDLNDWL